MTSRRIVVGVVGRGYREQRNITGLPLADVEFRQVLDPMRLLGAASYRVLGRTPQRVRYSHLDVGVARVDLFHHFFTIAITRRPWVLSASSYVPRWDRSSRSGIERVARDNCRRFIALSDNTWAVQRDALEAFPDLAERVAAKVTVVHPAQAPLVESAADKTAPDDVLHLVFVGADFFRKGGLEALRVVSRLLDEGAPLRLTVVSSLDAGDYASRAGTAELDDARSLLARHGDKIRHHVRLPNDEVLGLLRGAHAALLPTWADTYGYSVLEAQACACPVLTTDVRALPEVNDDACGWVVPVHKDGLGNAEIETAGDRVSFARHLEEGIEAALRSMLADPAEVARRGRAALDRIRRDHDPQDRARMLRAIYEDALA